MRHIAHVSLLIPLLASAEGSSERAIPPQRALSVDVSRLSSVALDIPVGELRVRGSDSGELFAEMVIRCAELESGCERRARETQLELSVEPDRAVVRTNRQASFGYRGMDVETEVRVPSGMALAIDFGYGALEVEGYAGCLDVEMSAGDVAVRMPLASVRAVHLRAGVGDASLQLGQEPLEGRRALLVGARVDWEEGQGACDLDVALRAGDIEVALE